MIVYVSQNKVNSRKYISETSYNLEIMFKNLVDYFDTHLNTEKIYTYFCKNYDYYKDYIKQNYNNSKQSNVIEEARKISNKKEHYKIMCLYYFLLCNGYGTEVLNAN